MVVPRRVATLLALLALAPALSGCVSLDAATVPDRLLHGSAQNGWVYDAARSEGPSSSGLTAKTAVRAYQDNAANGAGYRTYLTITSFRTLVAPDPDGLAERAQEFLEDESRRQGYDITGTGASGTREVAGGRPSQYFTFTAKATEDSDFFQRGATIKVIGEVFRCTSGAAVIAAATAQVNSARFVGGVLITENPDDRNWVEVVADPSGTIEGKRGSNGLIYNIDC